jgi:hypothetical protein
MRKDSIFQDVMKMPWPVGVGLAVIVFFMFHIYQLVAPQDQIYKILFSLVRMLAYILMGTLLLASFFSFFTQKIRTSASIC